MTDAEKITKLTEAFKGAVDATVVQRERIATLEAENKRLTDHLNSRRWLSHNAMQQIEAAESRCKALEAENAELADLRRQIDEAYAALGNVNRSVYLFDHIYHLRQEIAALRKGKSGGRDE